MSFAFWHTWIDWLKMEPGVTIKFDISDGFVTDNQKADSKYPRFWSTGWDIDCFSLYFQFPLFNLHIALPIGGFTNWCYIPQHVGQSLWISVVRCWTPHQKLLNCLEHVVKLGQVVDSEEQQTPRSATGRSNWREAVIFRFWILKFVSVFQVLDQLLQQTQPHSSPCFIEGHLSPIVNIRSCIVGRYTYKDRRCLWEVVLVAVLW